MTNFHSKLTRTAKKPTTQAGTFPGKIESVEIREMSSSYHESGKRDAVNLKVGLKQANGERCYEYYAPTLTWSPKGKLMKMLQDLQAVPAMGEQLDIDALVGMDVMVKVANVVVGAETHSNIVELKKSETVERGTFKKRKHGTMQIPDHQASPDAIDNELNLETENDDELESIDLDLDIEDDDDIDDLELDEIEFEDL